MGASFEDLETLNNLKKLIPELALISNLLMHRCKIHFIEKNGER